MAPENIIDTVITKLDALQASMNTIAEMLLKMQKNKVAFGDWVSEQDLIDIIGLKKSSLLKLRNEGKITFSTITGKQKYYRLSDFKKLLDKNEFKE